MQILTIFFLVTALFGLALAEDTPPAGEQRNPPAGRALLYRSAKLQPWDFPESVRADFDPVTHTPPGGFVLGPPGFWNEPSLRAHYEADIPLRYHPTFFPHPPPFDIWVKERRLIAAINLMDQAIRRELHRLTEHPSTYEQQLVLIPHEIQIAELTVLHRAFQIATVLKYAKLDPNWRHYEETWFRHWSSFLEIGKGYKGYADQWKEHLAFVEQVKQQTMLAAQERERMHAEAIERERQSAQADAHGKGKNVAEDGWRQVPVEKGDLQSGRNRGGLESSTPRRWIHVQRGTPRTGSQGETSGAASSTSRQWTFQEGLPSGSEEDIIKNLREATGKLHL